jgi:transposase
VVDAGWLGLWLWPSSSFAPAAAGVAPGRCAAVSRATPTALAASDELEKVARHSRRGLFSHKQDALGLSPGAKEYLAMTMVGLDLGKRKSWVFMKDDQGRVLVNKKVMTTREDLTLIFAKHERCTILMEASTSSEWVARHLEAMGHTVIVADPNFQPMYAHQNKRIKSDERDAQALWFALTVGAFRAAVRRSDEELFLRATLASRDLLVRTRTKYVNRTKATLQRFGIFDVDDTGEPEGYADKVRRDCGNDRLLEILEPSLSVLDEVTKKIDRFDVVLTAEAKENRVASRLDQIPGVGAITALAFVHALSDVRRFKNGDEVASYLGLVPSIYASGEREARGGITKRGDVVARTLLVGAALSIMRSKDPQVRALREWGLELAQRRGGKKKGGMAVAKCALARRLARIMFAMWRDDKPFTAERTAPISTKEELAAE